MLSPTKIMTAFVPVDTTTLGEKCPNMEFFLVRIFRHLD